MTPPLKVTAVTVGVVTSNRVTPGRSIKSVDVYTPTNPAQMPRAGGFTYFSYTPAATWTFQHPLGRVPQVSIYDLAGVAMDSDVDATVTTVTVTWARPTAGYVLLT